MTDEPKTLDEALFALQADPPILKKDKAGQAGNRETKYADLVQVNAVVLKRLNELGVMWICTPNLVDERTFVLEYELKHLASGDIRKGRYPLKMAENPQAMGSAITYARRYALLAVTGIAAEDEDDDGRADGKGTAQRKSRATPAQQAQTAQRGPSGPSLPAEGKPITDAQLRKMQTTFGEQGYARSEDRHEYITKKLAEHGVTRTISTSRDLTSVEAGWVIEALEKREDPAAAGAPA